MKTLHADSVREDLKHYARIVDESARATERYTIDLALEVEELDRSAGRSALSLEGTSGEYTTLRADSGFELLKTVEILDVGAFVNLVSSCQRVPLTDDVRARLRTYEHLKPSMIRMYDAVASIDGVFLFDTESNIFTFRTGHRLENDFDVPGVDLTTIHDLGIIFYDWFTIVDKENNPGRGAIWSPMAFIAVEHDWIMNLSAPIYRDRCAKDEKMIGVVAVHFNLDWMMADTIEKSAVKLMIVKDDSTLIGLNGAAKREIELEIFEKKNFLSMNGLDPATTRKKKEFVQETLNLEHGKSEDVASLAQRLKSEFQFHHTLSGKPYTVIRERAPELGLNLVALLDDSR